MALVIEQQFPLGRFHATRWNQNPFEDPYGEWPPSPWRLLRALAARWFQYARETGDTDEKKRNALLQTLADSSPSYYLPGQSWRGPTLKQYQPTKVDWTDRSAKAPAYKWPIKTLAEDHCRAVPPDEPVLWFWNQVELEPEQLSLLDSLLTRTIYFGRAESFCRMRRPKAPPVSVRPNCTLDTQDDGQKSPVLVPVPAQPLHMKVLLDATDGDFLSGRRIPPGTAWYYAPVPKRLPIARLRNRSMPLEERLNYLQFAVGGRVYPPANRWIKITERVRGRVLKCLSELVAGVSGAGYNSLTPEQRGQLTLMSGKDGNGKSIEGHRHTFFVLWPDDNGLPTRLIAWRRDDPFTPREIEALLRASAKPVSWEAGAPDWSVRLVPLPLRTPLPKDFGGEARAWISATPFVPPSARHRFRRNGRARPRETPERSVRRLLRACGISDDPERVIIESEPPVWVGLHETHQIRQKKKE
ncbi:MAG: type I-G CRISPR-associated protein Csb2, partial [Candidatus Acidiferrales bacterium]